jgi:hypothetical protein
MMMFNDSARQRSLIRLSALIQLICCALCFCARLCMCVCDFRVESDQSKLIDERLRGRRNGFFVECGAHDGEFNSNSLFFEMERNWTGLLIEPDPTAYEKLLQKNRKVCVVIRFL